ncbi:hypothetical protein NW752_011158 [Fusarium irregulare]|uniref:Uncharacterized protein n=1 Tax=Fusarium irregulare TaxID=2494466 RepID=A0A9W8PE47_9HYPO|nr:hypothetical protein NW766_012187 [Fusarium irregulare]KAJ4005828.1 hypothetical protein NW752_011158 [Fusarium irregulare]
MPSKTFFMTLLALGVSAAPLDAEVQKDSLDKRCDWNDLHGQISCGYFSVIMSFDDVKIRGDGWSEKFKIDCSREWSSLSIPRLPWTIEFHPGNACDGTNYDNMWIKYADTTLDIPSDKRCGAVGKNNVLRRCIIADKK